MNFKTIVSPLRALILDVCNQEDQNTGFNLHAISGGLGSATGFIISAINWENTFLKFIGNKCTHIHLHEPNQKLVTISFLGLGLVRNNAKLDLIVLVELVFLAEPTLVRFVDSRCAYLTIMTCYTYLLFKGNEMEIIFVFSSIIFCATLVITLVTAKERPLAYRNERIPLIGKFSVGLFSCVILDLFRSIFNIQKTMRSFSFVSVSRPTHQSWTTVS